MDDTSDRQAKAKPRASLSKSKENGVWISAADLVRKEYKEREWITLGIMKRGGLGLVYGIQKTGKTTLWVQYAIAVATGRDFFSLPTTKGTVLYIALEEPDDEMKALIKRLSPTSSPKFLIMSTMDRFPDDDKMKATIEGGAKLYKPNLVVLDPLLLADDDFAFSGGNKRIARLLRDLRKIANNGDFMLLLIHHSTKDQKKDFLLGALGGVALTAIPDVVIQVSRARGKARGTIKISGRGGVEERDIYMDFVNGVWRMAKEQEPDDEKSTELKTARLAVLKAIQPAGPKELADALGVARENTIEVWLTRMVTEGQVIKSEVKGKYEVAPDEDETVETERKKRRIIFEDEKKDEKK
ncbi:MAG: AAA family ATPase [Spirochaetia bacterium]|jgi:hypothetical protein